MSSSLPQDPTALRARLTALANADTEDAAGRVARAAALALEGRGPEALPVFDAIGPDAPLAEGRFSPAGAEHGLLTLVGVAAVRRALAQPDRWRDRLHDATEDAIGHPEAWRPLSGLATALTEVLEHGAPPPAAPLLDAVGSASLRAIPTPLADRAADTFSRVRQRLQREAWLAWFSELAAAWTRPLRDAMHAVDKGLVPLAAADGAADALARVSLAEVGDGELTLAALPSGLVLEWTGDGQPPSAIHVGDRPLASAEGLTVADKVWLLDAPPTAGLVLETADGRVAVDWPRS